MRWMGLALLFGWVGVAHAEVAPDPEPLPPAPAQLAMEQAPVQIATAGRCDRVTRLVGQDRGDVARTMRQRKLESVVLDAIVLPRIMGPASQTSLTTIRIGKRTVRGILVNLSGDGCIRPDHRHAIDRDGNLYQFDGPAGVVDYKQHRCHTPRGWERCNLTGQTHVLYVVPERVNTFAGVFGSDGKYYPLPL